MPLVSESDKDGDRGPIWNDSADWPIRGTDLRLICGPVFEDMLYRGEEKSDAGGGWMQRTALACAMLAIKNNKNTQK